MKKDFIKDDGKVRKCDYNVSRMNIIEFIYFYVSQWGYFSRIFGCIYECLKGIFEYGFGLIYNLVVFIFTPITLVMCAIFEIKKAKQNKDAQKSK